jgi:hypothetical protein
LRDPPLQVSLDHGLNCGKEEIERQRESQLGSHLNRKEARSAWLELRRKRSASQKFIQYRNKIEKGK